MIRFVAASCFDVTFHALILSYCLSLIITIAVMGIALEPVNGVLIPAKNSIGFGLASFRETDAGQIFHVSESWVYVLCSVLGSVINAINGDIEVQHIFAIAQLCIKFNGWIIADIRLNVNDNPEWG